MDNQYRGIYEEIWRRARLRRPGPFYWSSYEERLSYQLSMSAVEEALEKLHGIEVRDDAKIFLAINIHALVVLPQLMNAGSGDSLNRPSSDVVDNVTEDVTSTLFAAKEEARGGEISSAAIIRGLAKVLDGLNLKDARIWSEPDEG